MRFPRMTTGRWMIVVAAVAFALVIVPPAYVRLVWLYNNPPTTLALFAAEVNPARPQTPTGQARPWIGAVNQPTQVQCDYKVGLLPRDPTGIPYRVTVVVKLMDRPSRCTIFESRRKSSLLFAGKQSWNEVRGRFTCDLTPRSPGHYFVRYEINITDLFGRRALGACNTLGLQAN